MKKNNHIINYILGLDLGMASVGASLITCSETGHIDPAFSRIYKLLVRTFDKSENKDGKSLNIIRREDRLTRRNIRRRAHRLLRLRRLLKHYGIIPDKDLFIHNPNNQVWQLRSEGLDRLLTNYEFAIVIYHIMKRRGYQSNRKTDNIQKDEKKLLSAIKDNHKLLQNSPYRTVGELLYKSDQFRNQKRNRGGEHLMTIGRDDLREELQLLLKRQADFGNTLINETLKNEILKLFDERRPTMSGDQLLKMIGFCTLEPQERRAPKHSYSAQRFIWLSKLNNLKLRVLGQEARHLTIEEFESIKDLCYKQQNITYISLRKELKLDDSVTFISSDLNCRNSKSKKNKSPNDKSEENKSPEQATFYKMESFYKLKKSYENAGLSKQWEEDCHNSHKLDIIARGLSEYKTDTDIKSFLIKHEIDEDIIAAVLSIDFSQFINLSLKALQKILPYMEQGQRYDQAVQKAGYFSHSMLNNNKKGHFIPLSALDIITNPVVRRALHQSVKLINKVIEEYGLPRGIKLEFSRDIAHSKKEKANISAKQKDYKKYKDQLRSDYKKIFKKDPEKSNLLKYELYQEQDGKCAYSLKPIELNRLTEDGYVEIDHILPISRTFIDEKNNKCLVFTKQNRDKANSTPYEYLKGGTQQESWQKFKAWVNSNKKFNHTKKDRFLKEKLDHDTEKNFLNRNLNDTRYISKNFKALITKHLAVPEPLVISGGMTAYLRYHWGLEKDRTKGDLHHALDATVIALCSHSLIQKITKYHQQRECAADRKKSITFPEPWPTFKKELEAWLSFNPKEQLQYLDRYKKIKLDNIQSVRVSRKRTTKHTGSLHDETIYSKKVIHEEQSITRKKIEDLKYTDIPNIVGYDDPRNKPLIDQLKSLFDPHTQKPIKNKIITKPGSNKPIRGVKLQQTQNSGIFIREGVANNGDFLRIDLFKKGKKFFVVPIYLHQKNQQELPNRIAKSKKNEKNWPILNDEYEFIFSLQKNDWVCIKDKNHKMIEGYYRSFDRATITIKVMSHDNSVEEQRVSIQSAIEINKYFVDILGRLHKINNEKRKPFK